MEMLCLHSFRASCYWLAPSLAPSHAPLDERYVNIDDNWMEPTRDPEGNLITRKDKFPRGIKFLADYAHGKGLKLGIYSAHGAKTWCVAQCAPPPLFSRAPEPATKGGENVPPPLLSCT